MREFDASASQSLVVTAHLRPRSLTSFDTCKLSRPIQWRHFSKSLGSLCNPWGLSLRTVLFLQQ